MVHHVLRRENLGNVFSFCLECRRKKRQWQLSYAPMMPRRSVGQAAKGTTMWLIPIPPFSKPGQAKPRCETDI